MGYCAFSFTWAFKKPVLTVVSLHPWSLSRGTAEPKRHLQLLNCRSTDYKLEEICSDTFASVVFIIYLSKEFELSIKTLFLWTACTKNSLSLLPPHTSPANHRFTHNTLSSWETFHWSLMVKECYVLYGGHGPIHASRSSLDAKDMSLISDQFHEKGLVTPWWLLIDQMTVLWYRRLFYFKRSSHILSVNNSADCLSPFMGVYNLWKKVPLLVQWPYPSNYDSLDTPPA